MIVKLIASWLARKAYKSVSAWLTTTLAATGTAAALNPDLLQLIPEHYRGPAMIVVGALVAVSRLKQEYRAQKIAGTLPEQTPLFDTHH